MHAQAVKAVTVSFLENPTGFLEIPCTGFLEIPQGSWKSHRVLGNPMHRVLGNPTGFRILTIVSCAFLEFSGKVLCLDIMAVM